MRTCIRAGVPASVALLAIGATGCLPPPIVRDHASACRIARSSLRSPMSSADLVEVSGQFPSANRFARRAHGARIAAIVLTSFGAAGLVGSFVTGFATDTSQPAARTALYSVVGGTIGLGAGALLSTYLSTRARAQAYAALDDQTRAECP